VFNLQVYTIQPPVGREPAEFPGLLVKQPPKRVARNRDGDVLILLLKLDGQARLTDTQQKELLEKLAGIYYRTPGSVTAALRAMAASLNDFLLARNLKVTTEGGQIYAILNAAVLHGESVVLAQCGGTSTFVLGKDQVDAYREGTGVRGLGLSRAPAIRFFQAKAEPGCVVLFAHRPPESWTPENLDGSAQLGLEPLRRRLFNQAGSDLQAVMLRLQSGKGDVTVLPLPVGAPAREGGEPLPAVEAQPASEPPAVEPLPVEPVVTASVAEPVAAPEIPVPAAEPAVEQPTARRSERHPRQSAEKASLVERILAMGRKKSELAAASSETPMPAVYIGDGPVESKAESSLPAQSVVTEPSAVNERPVVRPTVPPAPVAAAVIETADDAAEAKPVRQPRSPRRAGPSPVQRKLKTGIARLWLRSNAAQNRMGQWGQKALVRLAPVGKHEAPRLSPVTLIFVAIAVPLMIAAVAATVYVRNGYGEQHRVNLGQAQQYANLAAEQPDRVLKHTDLTQSLEWIDKADTYGVSPESAALRTQVQQALDILDGIRRLDLRPATPTMFDPSINVSRMVAAVGEDIYVLDSTHSRIRRLIYTRPGYEIDPDFDCGPNVSPDGEAEPSMSPIVDLAPVRPNNPDGMTVMGIDAVGNQVLCGPGQTPLISPLNAPDAGWQNLTDVSIDGNTLYALDTKSSGVFRVTGDGVVFTGEPKLFFDNEVPVLGDATAIAVYQDDLFLLHNDGTMTLCTYSDFELYPTRCDMELEYNLAREGDPQNLQRILERPVTQMLATNSPAYSLFLFSPDGPTLYHFSLALNLQYVFRPLENGEYPLPNKAATAFLVTPGRRVLFAFGNEVYYGELP
jgi:hypothetical protein